MHRLPDAVWTTAEELLQLDKDCLLLSKVSEIEISTNLLYSLFFSTTKSS